MARSLIECPPATIPDRDMDALKEAEKGALQYYRMRELWSSFFIVPYLLTKTAHSKSMAALLTKRGCAGNNQRIVRYRVP